MPVLQDLVDVWVPMALEDVFELLHQRVLVAAHYPRREKVLEPVLTETALLLAQPAESLVVGVPHPLGHAGQPALAALGLDVSYDLVVRERVQAAEDLPDHTY